MAIVFFDSETKSTDSVLPWVDDYYAKLSNAKKAKFIDATFVCVSGNQAGKKGWIVECLEFKAWVWMEQAVNLLAAVEHSKIHECKLIVKFSLVKSGRLKPVFGVDSEIPSLLDVTEKRFLTKDIF